MSEATVIIGTFGDESWAELGRLRARPSVEAQTVPADVLNVHAASLAEARNAGAARAGTEWLCFLDADDELAPDYIAEMLAADGDIRRPNTQGVHQDGHEEDPSMIPVRDLRTANYIVIGALVRRDLFMQVGGFDPDLTVLEDWDLWLRCWLAGGEVTDVPTAIYRIHITPGSRNLNHAEQHRVYQRIKGRYRNAKRQTYRTVEERLRG